MTDFATLVKVLGQELGLDASWEPKSPVEMEIDGLTVNIASDRRSGEEEVIFWSRLGQIPQERELVTYRILLEANVLWSATGDATLGVNSATREAVMCFRIMPSELKPAAFVAAVAAFAQQARSWSDFVTSELEEELPPGETLTMMRV
jgi:Tir chaperone protein (CesT) family